MNATTDQTSNKSTGSLMGAIFLLLGLFCLFAGGYYGVESWRLVENGQETIGQVVDYDQRLDDDQVMNYSPILQYQVDGQLYRFISANYKYSPNHPIGEELPILYDPEKPGKARIYSLGELWGLPAGLGIAGLLVSMVGVGMLSRKSDR